MILKMFSIFDAKASIFHPPFYKRSHGEAERDFSQTANNKETQLNQFPEDYDLYYLGEYDDNSGKFEPLKSPQHVTKAVQQIRAAFETKAAQDLESRSGQK